VIYFIGNDMDSRHPKILEFDKDRVTCPDQS